MKSTRRRRSLVPWGESLEARVVQSGVGAPASVASLLRSPGAAGPGARPAAQLGRPGPARGGGAFRVSDRVEAAFDSFTNDFLQAQALYLEAVATPGMTEEKVAPSRKLFIASIETRVSVLAQDLTRSLSRLPNALSRERGASVVPLQSFLSRNILNPDPKSNSLLANLTQEQAIPPAGTSGAAASLYTLNALNAIEAAEAATGNGAGFLSSNQFRPRH